DLFTIMESRDVTAAQQCLALLAARVQSGELQAERLEKLRSQLAPVIAKFVQSGAAHPLGLDAALLAVSWKDPLALGYVRQTFVTAGLDPELRLRALRALISGGDESVLDSASAALTAKVSPRPGAKQMPPAE